MLAALVVVVVAARDEPSNASPPEGDARTGVSVSSRAWSRGMAPPSAPLPSCTKAVGVIGVTGVVLVIASVLEVIVEEPSTILSPEEGARTWMFVSSSAWPCGVMPSPVYFSSCV